jgi:hypothetical protein
MRALAFLGLFLAGCVESPCFVPPPTSSSTQRDIMVKLAAQISAIPVTPSIETDFKNQVNVSYAMLNDADATYFLAAQLALCFAEKGKWGRDVAGRILIDLEADWKARKAVPK